MKKDQGNEKADNLTKKMGILTRREVEARILGPVIEALGNSFGKEAVVKIVRETIVTIAEKQGHELAEAMDGNTSAHFLDSLKYWSKDDALELKILKHDESQLHFDVTRCRYAEMYQALGLAELGKTLSCNRDFALIKGFNPETSLSRTQTIMDGAPFCNFRYTFTSKKGG